MEVTRQLRILVMSDSHGSKKNMFEAIDIETPDVILHLGDNIRDCYDVEALYPEIMLRAVKGNCDGGYPGAEIDEFVLEDKRFLMTHGHLFGVKHGKARILEVAKSRGADILLFGHTHIPYHKEENGLIALNPGSIGYGEKSYAVLELKNGVVEYEFGNL